MKRICTIEMSVDMSLEKLASRRPLVGAGGHFEDTFALANYIRSLPAIMHKCGKFTSVEDDALIDHLSRNKSCDNVDEVGVMMAVAVAKRQASGRDDVEAARQYHALWIRIEAIARQKFNRLLANERETLKCRMSSFGSDAEPKDLWKEHHIFFPNGYLQSYLPFKALHNLLRLQPVGDRLGCSLLKSRNSCPRGKQSQPKRYQSSADTSRTEPAPTVVHYWAADARGLPYSYGHAVLPNPGMPFVQQPSGTLPHCAPMQLLPLNKDLSTTRTADTSGHGSAENERAPTPPSASSAQMVHPYVTPGSLPGFTPFPYSHIASCPGEVARQPCTSHAVPLFDSTALQFGFRHPWLHPDSALMLMQRSITGERTFGDSEHGLSVRGGTDAEQSRRGGAYPSTSNKRKLSMLAAHSASGSLGDEHEEEESQPLTWSAKRTRNRIGRPALPERLSRTASNLMSRCKPSEGAHAAVSACPAHAPNSTVPGVQLPIAQTADSASLLPLAPPLDLGSDPFDCRMLQTLADAAARLPRLERRAPSLRPATPPLDLSGLALLGHLASIAPLSRQPVPAPARSDAPRPHSSHASSEDRLTLRASLTGTENSPSVLVQHRLGQCHSEADAKAAAQPWRTAQHACLADKLNE